MNLQAMDSFSCIIYFYSMADYINFQPVDETEVEFSKRLYLFIFETKFF